MTEARLIKVATPLARQLARPGGRSVADAERRASAALEDHRLSVLDDLGRLIGELEALCAARAPDAAPEVYRRAATLVDLAGFFDTGPLYDAAFSLCELSDRIQAGPAWAWPPIEVHVQALRLIHAGGCTGGGEAETLLKGLKAVLAATEG